MQDGEAFSSRNILLSWVSVWKNMKEPETMIPETSLAYRDLRADWIDEAKHEFVGAEEYL